MLNVCITVLCTCTSLICYVLLYMCFGVTYVEKPGLHMKRCCVCFTTYEDDVLNKTGKDWVGCVCASRGVYGGLCVG